MDGRSTHLAMHVALFGGSFNPPHVAHQMVGLYVLETAPVDELWFVPCFKHPFDKALLGFEHRYEMCLRAAAPLGARARVSDVERELGGDSRTLLTVRALKRRHPEAVFSLVIGADLVAESSTWYGAEELRREVPFIIVGRSGAGPGGGVDMPAVSSTEVRRALAEDRPVDALVPRSVLAYIRENGLFGAKAVIEKGP